MRANLESSWGDAGAHILTHNDTDAPDPIAVELTAAEAFEQLSKLRTLHAHAHVVAFGPHVHGEAFKAARAVGTPTQGACGKVPGRVLAQIAKPERGAGGY